MITLISIIPFVSLQSYNNDCKQVVAVLKDKVG